MMKVSAAITPALIALTLALGYWAGSKHQKEVETLFGKFFLQPVSHPLPAPSSLTQSNKLYERDKILSEVVELVICD